MKRFIYSMMLMAAFIMVAPHVQAQSYTLKNVGRNFLKSSGTVMDGNVVKGYFFFYLSDRADRKNSNFEIVVLDADLNEVTAKTIKEPNTTYLLESSYNGQNILFKFLDSKAKTISYRTLSTAGVLSKTETRTANKYELAMLLAGVSKDLKNTNLNSIDDKLFIDIYTFKQKKYKYQIQGVDAKGSIAWTYDPADRKGVTGGSYLAANNDQILILQSETKSITSRDVKFKLISISKKGEQNFEMDMINKKYNMLPISATVNKDQSFTIMGEYFDIGDKAFKSESMGIFVKSVSADGEPIEEVFLSWSRDIGSEMPSEHKRSLKSFSVFFHHIFVTQDGSIYAIGEQYRKQVSAGGVALQVLASASGNVSTSAGSMEIVIGNMVMIKINPNLEVDKVEVWEKHHSNIILPQGYGTVNKHLMARILDAEGFFDYSYTQNNEDNSLFTVAYADREKEKGKIGKNAVIQFVNFSAGESESTTDKLDLETDATEIITFPAKPGHVLIYEYFRKEKKIEVRLEPINF